MATVTLLMTLQRDSLTRHNQPYWGVAVHIGTHLQRLRRIDLNGCFALTAYIFNHSVKSWLLLASLGLVIFGPASQAQVKKTILVINEFGQSTPVSVLVANRIRSALQSDRRFQDRVLLGEPGHDGSLK